MTVKKNKISVGKTVSLTFRMFSLWNRAYPNIFTFEIIRILFSKVSSYATIALSAVLLDKIAAGGDFETVLPWGMAVVFVQLLFRSFDRFVFGWFSWQKLNSYNIKTRNFYSEKMLDIDFLQIDSPEMHALLEKINEGEFRSGWGLGRARSFSVAFFTGFFDIIGSTALSVTLFTSSVPATGGNFTFLNSPVFAVIIPLFMLGVTFLSSFFSIKASEYDNKLSEKSGLTNRLFGFFMSFSDNPETSADIRIYGQEKFVDGFSNFPELTFSPKGLGAKYAKGGQGLLSAASSAVSGLFTGFVYLFVGLKAWAGAFGVGSVMQYISAITNLSSGIGSFLQNFGLIRTNAAFLENTFKFLDTKSVMDTGSLPVPKDNPEIEFRNVSFIYPGTEDYALKNVSIKFRVGEKLAIVGENGSGKSTFIKLLCRLYDPTEGEILLNGINIKEYSYAEYLSVFSVVFQDFGLLPFSIAENVAASENYDPEKVKKCLAEAGFSDRSEKLQDGINTMISKYFDDGGVGFSGGESQKIAIARALYRDSPFVVLDEPTAALDPVAEYEIYSKFDKLVEGKTSVFISHRLSSCRFCEDIAVFDKGRLIQRGDHKTLLSEENGKYSELWNAQAQYYA